MSETRIQNGNKIYGLGVKRFICYVLLVGKI